MIKLIIFVAFITHSGIPQNSNNALKTTAPSLTGMRDEPVVVGATILKKMEEIWKDIAGYEGFYQVSNLGKIKSLDRHINPNVKGSRNVYGRSMVLMKNRYSTCTLIKNKIRKNVSVHRLVAQAFIPNDDKTLIVNHIDGDRYNNIVSNLEWVTYKYNNLHAYRTGLKNGGLGENNNRGRLTEVQVQEIRMHLWWQKHTWTTLARKYGTQRQTIERIAKRTSWAHLPPPYQISNA